MDFARAQRLASFTELNPRPVVELDLRGNILYMNASAQALLTDLKKNGLRHPYLSDFKKILAFLKLHKGETFPREIKTANAWFRQFFYYLPHFKSVLLYGTDITDRKEAELAVTNSEKRYHMLFEKMNYGYALQDIIFDKQGRPADYRFIDVNPAFEKLAYMKKEFIIGKTVNEITRHPQSAEDLQNRKKYDTVAVSGQPVYFENYNAATKKYLELYAYRPNKNQVALIFSDITARKKTDEEKNNFIAIMSHELRNPLTPVMANAQFVSALLERQKAADPVIKESIDVIEKQAKIMADLLNDILDVSRMSQHKIHLKKSRVNLVETIKNSIKASMPFINTKGQEISLAFSQKAIYTQADPLRLEQIMVNIINNASKYTQPGGHINVHCGVKNSQIEIRVKDNGIGMEVEKMKRIFELFSDNSQPFMGIGGLGIGLNIVKNLVSMHKGSIVVNSQGKNKGSEFIITLPAGKNNVAPHIPTPAKKEALNNDGHAKTKILVVDDNEDIRSAISKILQQEGYQIKTSHNGTQALKIARAFKPDVGLIDIGLPDMTGYAVATQLRKQAGNPKLIAFSGYSQSQDKKQAKESGFDYHLTKPVDIAKLLDALGRP